LEITDSAARYFAPFIRMSDTKYDFNAFKHFKIIKSIQEVDFKSKSSYSQ